MACLYTAQDAHVIVYYSSLTLAERPQIGSIELAKAAALGLRGRLALPAGRRAAVEPEPEQRLQLGRRQPIEAEEPQNGAKRASARLLRRLGGFRCRAPVLSGAGQRGGGGGGRRAAHPRDQVVVDAVGAAQQRLRRKVMVGARGEGGPGERGERRVVERARRRQPRARARARGIITAIEPCLGAAAAGAEVRGGAEEAIA
jgi:hypothetical protein